MTAVPPATAPLHRVAPRRALKVLVYACVIGIYAIGSVLPAGAQTFRQIQGRIAYSSDGNNFDRDDIGSSAMTLLLIDAARQNGKLVHFDYANYIWGNGPNNMYEETIITAMQGQDRFDFPPAIFHNAFANPRAAIESVAREIDKSTSANPLTLMAAGPMHIYCEGIKRSQPHKRRFVTLLSHGNQWTTYNQKTSVNGSCNLAGIERLSPTVMVRKIQHGTVNLSRDDYDDYNWMGAHPNPDVRWALRRMKVALPDRAKVGDANLILYLITGRDDIQPRELRQYLD